MQIGGGVGSSTNHSKYFSLVYRLEGIKYFSINQSTRRNKSNWYTDWKRKLVGHQQAVNQSAGLVSGMQIVMSKYMIINQSFEVLLSGVQIEKNAVFGYQQINQIVQVLQRVYKLYNF